MRFASQTTPAPEEPLDPKVNRIGAAPEGYRR